MGKKAISNTFTVNTIDDGQSAPYYFQEWFAWSSAPTTPSAATEPTPNGGWQTSIPEQGSYAYLWRKCVRMVYNATTNDYDAEAAQYFRMSGLNGTSIKTKGSVIAVISRRGTFPTTGVEDGDIVIKDFDRTPYRATIRGMIVTWDAMSNADYGDSYTVIKTCYYSPNDELNPPDVKGHLFSYSEEASKWLDLGKFQGENGETWYTHVAWATNVDTSTTPITVTDFVTTKSPNDTTHIWMGVLVDQNSGQDSSNATLYTWSNTKGDGAAVATCSPDKISIQCNADGSVVSTTGYSVSFGLKVGSIDISQYITNVTRGSLPTGVSISSTPVAYAKTIVVSNTATATGMASGITFTVSASYSGKTYSASMTVALIGVVKGGVGERGKVGRFFYFAGTFNSQDNDPTHVFVVNDAQAPYFEHTENEQKRYHVFNYETNGSYTMAQMWSISSSSWNNSPWEAMTNDFKYIISEALFANFAKLGSFVISGDWMLSTNGKINGTDYNDGAMYNGASAYTWFDPDYPNTDHVTDGKHNFIPNYAVDGLTGETYQQNAHIKGEIIATSGSIGGFNITSSQIKSSNSNIILNSDGSATIGGFEIAVGGTARLKSTLTVGNATSQRIEIIPFLNGTYGSQAIQFIKSGTGVSKEVVMNLGFGNDNYGYIQISKPATNQDVIDKYISIDAGSVIIRYQNTDYDTLNSIDVKTEPDGAFSQFCYDEPGELEKRLECGIRNKTIYLRAYNPNGDSAWPEYSHILSPDNLTKGLVHVMSLGSLKAIFDGTNYRDRLSKLSVLLIRNNT